MSGLRVSLAVQVERYRKVAQACLAQVQHARTKYKKHTFNDPAKCMNGLFRFTRAPFAPMFAFAVGPNGEARIVPIELGAFFDGVWGDSFNDIGENVPLRVGSWVGRHAFHILVREGDAFKVLAFSERCLGRSRWRPELAPVAQISSNPRGSFFLLTGYMGHPG